MGDCAEVLLAQVESESLASWEDAYIVYYYICILCI